MDLLVNPPLLTPVASTSRGDRPRDLPALTSARFFAALSVALYHFLPADSFLLSQRPHGALRSAIGAGYVGVTFFFMLSGFILTYSHGLEYESGKDHTRRFYFARFARVYPLYLLSVVLAVVLYASSFRVLRRAFVLPVHLLLLQAWSVRTLLFLNIPAWTLSCEAFFYAVFPLLLLRLRPKSFVAAWGWVAGFWVLALVVPTVVLFASLGWHWQLWEPEQPVALAFLFNPLATLPEFLAGVVLGWVQLHFPPRRRISELLFFVGAGAVLLALSCSHYLPDAMLRNGLLMPAFGALLLGLSGDNAASRALSAAPFVLLGEASYAFYLMHYLLNSWFTDRLHAPPTGTNACWKLVVLIPVSVALFRWVERPARRWLLQRWPIPKLKPTI